MSIALVPSWPTTDQLFVTPEMFGAPGTGDETVSVQAAIDYGVANNLPVRLQRRDYHVTGLKANNVGDPSARPIANFAMFGQPGTRAYDGTVTPGTRLVVDAPTSGTIALDIEYCPWPQLRHIAVTPQTSPATHHGTGIGIKLFRSQVPTFYQVTANGWATGLSGESSGIGQYTECALSNNNSGAVMVYCGDSQWTDNYVNTNNTDYLGTDLYSGAGLVFWACGNSTITGGKVEWNAKGILLIDSPGCKVDVQTDSNAEYAVAVIGDAACNAFAINPANSYSTEINVHSVGDGFVGDLNTKAFSGGSVCIYRASHVKVSGVFADGGRAAYDGNTDGTIGPKYAFVRVNLGNHISVDGEFHPSSDTPPLHIYDWGNTFRSMVHYRGHSEIAPKMGFYGDGSSEQRTYHAYDTDTLGRRRMWTTANADPVTDGMFNVGDIVYNSNSPTTGRRCTVGGTLGTLTTTVTASTTATSKVVTLSAHLDETKIQPGDYITIAGVTGAKKVLRIDSPSGGPLTMTVDTACDATVTGAALSYSAPTFVGF